MSPVFAHGQLRLYLLAVLDEGPRHGYEIMRALEERFDGLYAPSAGTIYPRLSKLEEEGLVERMDEGRKAIYRITELGRSEVAARRLALADLQQDLDHSIRSLADDVRSRVHGTTRDLRAELKAAATQARRSATAASHDDDGGDLESALALFRRDVREAVRRGRPDPAAAAEVAAVLRRTVAEIRTILGSP